MSGYMKVDNEKNVQRRPEHSPYYDVEIEKRKEEVAIRNKKKDGLFSKGSIWYIQGKKLDDALKLVNDKGQKMTDEEFKYFTLGFCSIPISEAKHYAESIVSPKDKDKYDKEVGFWFGEKRFGFLPTEFNNNNGIEGFGKGYGYSGANVHELPKDYVGKKAFLMGYRAGIKEKASEEDNKKRR